MEKSGNDRQLHMRILKFTQIGSCVDDDMASLQKNPTSQNHEAMRVRHYTSMTSRHLR
jgi:hypothetical protein